MSKPELKEGGPARPTSPPIAKPPEKKQDDDSSSDSFQHIAGDANKSTTAAPPRNENGKDKDKSKDKEKVAEKKKPDTAVPDREASPAPTPVPGGGAAPVVERTDWWRWWGAQEAALRHEPAGRLRAVLERVVDALRGPPAAPDEPPQLPVVAARLVAALLSRPEWGPPPQPGTSQPPQPAAGPAASPTTTSTATTPAAPSGNEEKLTSWELRQRANDVVLAAADLLVARLRDLPPEHDVGLLPELAAALTRALHPSMGLYGRARGGESGGLKGLFHTSDAAEALPATLPEPDPQRSASALAVSLEQRWARAGAGAPPLLVANINYLGSRAAFDVFCAALSKREAKGPWLLLARSLLELMVAFKDSLSREFAEQLLLSGGPHELQRHVFEHLLLLTTDDLTRDEKAYFKDAGAAIQRLLARVLPDDSIDELVERFNLDMGLRCLRTSSLEKRIRGVKMIQKPVRRTLKKAEERSRFALQRWTAWAAAQGQPQGDGHKEQGKPMDAGLLIRWLTEHKVAELLLRDEHPEVVRQGLVVLQFLAHQNELAAEHIDRLWTAQAGKHESVKNTVLGAVLELLPYLAAQARAQLAERLRSTPLPDVDAETLHFTLRFTQALLEPASSSSHAAGLAKVQWNGLTLLWQLTLDESPATQQVGSLAFRYLQQLLDLPAAAPQRPAYAEAAAERLAAGSSVAQAAELLCALVEGAAGGKKKKKRSAAAGLLEALDNKFHLVRALLRALERTVRGPAPVKPPRNDRAATMRACMALLEALLWYSGVTLTPGDIDQLWTLLAVPPAADADTQLFYNWLDAVAGAAAGSGGDMALDEALAAHAFARLTAADPLTLSPAGFRVFLRFFYLVNERLGKVKMVSLPSASTGSPTGSSPASVSSGVAGASTINLLANMSSSGAIAVALTGALALAAPPVTGEQATSWFVLVAADAAGLRALWSLGLDARDEGVAVGALASLNALHVGLGADAHKPRVGRLREEYVRTALTHLGQAAEQLRSSPRVPAAAVRMGRLLRLLRAFAAGFEAPFGQYGLVAAGGPAAASAADGPVWFVARPEGLAAFRVRLQARDTVAAVRQRVAEAYGRSAALLRISIADTELREADGSLRLDQLPTVAALLAGRDPTAHPVIAVRSLEAAPRVLFGPPSSTTGGPALPAEERGEWRLDELRYVLLELLQLQMRSCGLTGLLSSSVVGSASSNSISAAVSSSTTTVSVMREPDAGAVGAYHAIRLLGTEEASRQLYGLLELSGGDLPLAEAAWALLNLLPRPERLLSELKDADACRRLLADSAHRFKQLHALQLALQLARDETWCSSFAAQGGPAFLAGLAGQLRGQPQPHEAFALLFRLLARLLLQPLAPGARSAYDRELRPVATSPGLDRLALVKAMLLSSWDAVRDTSRDRGDVLLAALPLLVPLLQADEDLLLALYGFEALPDWLRAVLLASPNAELRAEAAAGLAHLASRLARRELRDSKLQALPHTVLLEHLLRFLPAVDSYATTCAEYFALLRRLVKQQTGVPRGHWMGLAIALVSQLRALPARERFDGAPGSEDHVLVGLLRLLRTLFRMDAGLPAQARDLQLIDELWSRCLFALPGARCRSRDARHAAFALLCECARGHREVFREVMERAERQLATLRVGAAAAGAPSERSAFGYVGLVNQGATCYMNSLIQQMYLVPRFRRAILALDVEPKRDSLLAQLQNLFAHLALSRRRAFDTIEFCGTCRDPDGRPVNVGVQMDANEFFLNQLVDRLEQQLRAQAPAAATLLAQCFGGLLSNQLIPLEEECSHKSERPEPFYTVSLEVKHKKTLEDALRAFVEGERLDGANAYKCEVCNRGVATLKRACLRHLPDTLLLHLKRFEFDFDALKNCKLNDELSFPTRLDLEPYTSEGLARKDAEAAGQPPPPRAHPPAYYDYELVGVVVHLGTADCGHYYSFARARDGPSRGRWFEFNDSNIAPFTPARIPDECFGGREEVTVVDRESRQERRVERAKAYNAYILVYERNMSVAPPPPLVPEPAPPGPAPSPTPDLSSTSTAGSGAAAAPTHDDSDSDADARARRKREHKERKDKKDKKDKEHKKEKKEKKEKEPLKLLDRAEASADNEELEGDGALVPARVREKVAADNRLVLLERWLLQPEFFHALWALLNLHNHSPNARPADASATWDPHTLSLETATRLLLEVYAAARDRAPAGLLLRHVRRMYARNAPAARGFLRRLLLPQPPARRGQLRYLLLASPHEPVRTVFVELLSALAAGLLPDHRAHYPAEAKLFERLDAVLAPPQPEPLSAPLPVAPAAAAPAASATSVAIKDAAKPAVAAPPVSAEVAKPPAAPERPVTVTEDTAVLDEDLEEWQSRVNACPSIALALLESLLRLLRSIRRYPRTCSQYFALLKMCAEIGYEERHYLVVRRGLLRRLLDFYLQQGDYVITLPPSLLSTAPSSTTTPIVSVVATTSPSSTSTPSSAPLRVPSPGTHAALFDLLSYLIRASSGTQLRLTMDSRDSREEKDELLKEARQRDARKKEKEHKEKEARDSPFQAQGQLLEMGGVEVEILCGKAFFARAVREDLNTDAIHEIICHLSWETPSWTKFFFAVAKEGLLGVKYDGYRPYLKLIAALQNIKDSLRAWRSLLGCEVIVTVMEQNRKSKETVEVLIEFLSKGQADKNEEVKQWISKNRDQLIHFHRAVQNQP